MKFDIRGGGQLEACSDVEVVAALQEARKHSIPAGGTQAFMEAMARRYRGSGEAYIRSDAVLNFVQDLQQYYLLIPVEDPWKWIAANTLRAELLLLAPHETWNHRLLWSFEWPQVLSSQHPAGGLVVGKYIDVGQLADSAYQQAWVKEHIQSLRRA